MSLVRVGNDWIPSDLLTARNQVGYFSEQVRIQTNIYNRTRTDYIKERRYTDYVLPAQQGLAWWRNEYSRLKDFYAGEGAAGIQQSYDNLKRITAVSSSGKLIGASTQTSLRGSSTSANVENLPQMDLAPIGLLALIGIIVFGVLRK